MRAAQCALLLLATAAVTYAGFQQADALMLYLSGLLAGGTGTMFLVTVFSKS